MFFEKCLINNFVAVQLGNIGEFFGCVRLPEWTGMGRITGMDYRNGLLYAVLSASYVF